MRALTPVLDLPKSLVLLLLKDLGAGGLDSVRIQNQIWGHGEFYNY